MTFLIAVTLRNHCCVFRKMIGVLHLQQCPNRCSMMPLQNRMPFSLRSSMSSGFAFLMCIPRYFSPTSALNLPLASTGQKGSMPNSLPSSKSSGPWPGAMCTRPVLAASTVLEGMTLCTHFPSTFFWYGTSSPNGGTYSVPTRSSPFDRLQDVVLLPAPDLPDLVDQVLQDDDRLGLPDPAVADLGVLEIGMRGHGHVRRQRPRGGGPDEQRDLLVVPQRELDIDGRVLLVPSTRSPPRPAPSRNGGTRKHPVRGDQQALVMGPLQGPPGRLDVT